MHLYFLRHGEAFHNTDKCKKLKEVPRVSHLTAVGREQASKVVIPKGVNEIWVSPSRRTMETAYLAGLYPFHVKYELAEIDKSIMFICNGGDEESLKEFKDKGAILSTNEEVPLLNEKEHRSEIYKRIDTLKITIDDWFYKNREGTLVIVGHVNLFNWMSEIELDKGQIMEVDMNSYRFNDSLGY